MDKQKILNWNLAHAINLLFASAGSLLFNKIVILIFPAFFSFLVLCFQQKAYLKTLKPYGGVANRITFFRLLLISTTALLYTHFSYLFIFALFSLNIILDVVDGKLARKHQQQSFFGQYFDMEADAFFIAIVCHILYFTNLAGGWIIVIGLLRYINVFAFHLFNIQHHPEPKRKYASYIAGFLFVAVLLPFLSQHILTTWLLIVASVAVIFSFSVSFKYQLNANFKIK